MSQTGDSFKPRKWWDLFFPRIGSKRGVHDVISWLHDVTLRQHNVIFRLWEDGIRENQTTTTMSRPFVGDGGGGCVWIYIHSKECKAVASIKDIMVRWGYLRLDRKLSSWQIPSPAQNTPFQWLHHGVAKEFTLLGNSGGVGDHSFPYGCVEYYLIDWTNKLSCSSSGGRVVLRPDYDRETGNDILHLRPLSTSLTVLGWVESNTTADSTSISNQASLAF